MTSDFFGLRTTVDKETLRDIDRKRELGLKEDKTDEERRELALLNEKLGRLDFSKSAPDPLYLEYIRAITAAQKEHPEIGEAAPDSEIWRLRKKIAKDIAEKIVSRGELE